MTGRCSYGSRWRGGAKGAGLHIGPHHLVPPPEGVVVGDGVGVVALPTRPGGQGRHAPEGGREGGRGERGMASLLVEDSHGLGASATSHQNFRI